MVFQLDRPAVLVADDQGILQVPGKTTVMTRGHSHQSLHRTCVIKHRIYGLILRRLAGSYNRCLLCLGHEWAEFKLGHPGVIEKVLIVDTPTP